LIQGISPKVVQAILGHSSIRLTMDTYSHVQPELQREAAEKMQAGLQR
jgi:integrase